MGAALCNHDRICRMYCCIALLLRNLSHQLVMHRLHTRQSTPKRQEPDSSQTDMHAANPATSTAHSDWVEDPCSTQHGAPMQGSTGAGVMGCNGQITNRLVGIKGDEQP